MGGPFIVLRLCGISQIYHTYSEGMHPINIQVWYISPIHIVMQQAFKIDV